MRTSKTLIFRIIAFAFFIFASALTSRPIDLTEKDVYVRRGFSYDWTNKKPETDLWTKIPAKYGRKLAFEDVEIPDFSQRFFLSPFQSKAATLTFLFLFELKETDLKQSNIKGLYLAEIGESWEIYLNGKLAYSYRNTLGAGNATKHRHIKNLLVDLHPDLLRKGENILAFKIAGEPTYAGTGLSSNMDYIIGDYSELLKGQSHYLQTALSFVYLFFGIFHLMLFITRTRETYNLHFALFALTIFLLNMFRSSEIYGFVNDSRLIVRLELSFLFLTLTSAGMFIEYLLLARISVYLKIYAGFCSLAVLLIWFLPLSFGLDMKRLWQAVSLIYMVYLLINMTRGHLKVIKNFYRHGAKMGKPILWASAIFYSLIRSISGNLLLGVALSVAGFVIEFLDYMYFSSGLKPSPYTTAILMVGLSFSLANKMHKTQERVSELNDALNQKVSDLKEANIKIVRSEEQYRKLVEVSEDIVFTLDENLKILNYNKNIQRKLKFSSKMLESMNYLDLIGAESGKITLEKNMVQERLNLLLQSGNPIHYNTDFQINNVRETLRMQVSMEVIHIDGTTEIFGRASNILEDQLLQFFISEKSRHKMLNSVLFAEELSQTLTKHLPKYMSGEEVDKLRMALRGILLNSVEHGNLGISPTDRAREIKNETYPDFISARLKDPTYKNKKIAVDYTLSSTRIAFRIQDEGNGFDHQSLRNQAVSSGNNSSKGISAAISVFDNVDYNTKGNEVVLIKNFEALKGTPEAGQSPTSGKSDFNSRSTLD